MTHIGGCSGLGGWGVSCGRWAAFGGHGGSGSRPFSLLTMSFEASWPPPPPPPQGDGVQGGMGLGREEMFS